MGFSLMFPRNHKTLKTRAGKPVVKKSLKRFGVPVIFFPPGVGKKPSSGFNVEGAGETGKPAGWEIHYPSLCPRLLSLCQSPLKKRLFSMLGDALRELV